jgi:tetratricopeptide (TPR) repeat protein
LQESRRHGARLVHREPSVTSAQFSLARTGLELAVLAMEGDGGVGSGPDRLFEQATAILVQQLAQNPDWNDARALLARTWHQHALGLRGEGRPGEALACWQDAAKASGRLVEEDPVNRTNHRKNEARSLFFAGDLLEHLERGDEAVAVLEKCRARYSELELAGSNLQLGGERERLAQVCNSLGLLYADRNAPEEAEKAYAEALRILESLRESEPANAARAILAGGVSCNLGHLRGGNGDLEGALESYRAAEDALHEALRLNPGDETAADYLYNTLVGRVERLAEGGDLARAIEAGEEAVRDSPSAYRASFRLRLAYLCAKQGDHRRAVKELEAIGEGVQFDAAARLNVAQVWALNAGAARGSDPDGYDRYVRQAIDTIKACLDEGSAKIAEVAGDEDFAAIADTPEFRALVGGGREP